MIVEEISVAVRIGDKEPKPTADEVREATGIKEDFRLRDEPGQRGNAPINPIWWYRFVKG